MSHHSHHPLRAIALLAGALVLLTGCGHTILERIDSRTSMRQLRRSALTENEASEHTLQIVRRLQLEKVYRKTPKKALAALAERLRASGDRETAFALSELAFLHVRRGHLSNADGRTYTTSAARYAHACLFDASLGPFFSEFDPRFRLAADLYNQSLAQLARLWRDDDYDPRWFQGEVGMVGGAATVVASERVKGLEKELKRSRLAFDYRIDAFANRRRRFGLGLPLVVPESEAGAPQSELIRQAGVRAASLFVSFSGSARKPHTVATVRLYDAIDNPSFEEGRRRVPLEADFTAPLAYILQERRQFLGLTAIRRVLRGDAVAEKRGLYLFQPYRSDRIPVVMVHGLMSSPMTWLPMFNELIADPALTQRYQFWFFFYPTGNPILQSAREFRDALAEARRTHDPEGDDDAFDQMVLVGHSMGGVVSRLAIMSSDGSLWSDFDQRNADMRALLQFKPVPSVSRVIFMAAPHRGAIMAESLVGRIGKSMVSFPGYLLEHIADALPQTGLPLDKIPTGIGNLSPHSRFMKRFNKLEMSPDVPFHLVIGNKKQAGVAGGSDGVVAYESSHLGGAQSELIVESPHNVQNHPLAIEEVRRILFLHAREEAPE